MNSSISGLARLATFAKNPTGKLSDKTATMQDFDELLNCFSEIDTESTSSLESNKVAYLEQMLRLQEPVHLSATQLSGRRFLLDMLSRLSKLPQGQPSQAAKINSLKDWHPTHNFKYLIYLLERTSRSEMAAKVQAVKGIQDFDEADLIGLGQWLHRYGITARELALIQPSFFAGDRQSSASPTERQGIHPQFEALAEASRARSHDYLAEAFLSISEPLKLVPSVPVATVNASMQGRGEALGSIFDSPYDQKAATQTRLKAYLIPNKSGESMVALSFVNEY
jgi:hypothetical protein